MEQSCETPPLKLPIPRLPTFKTCSKKPKKSLDTKLEDKRLRDRNRVYLCAAFQRWRDLRLLKGFRTDQDLATFLMDRFKRKRRREETSSRCLDNGRQATPTSPSPSGCEIDPEATVPKAVHDDLKEKYSRLHSECDDLRGDITKLKEENEELKAKMLRCETLTMNYSQRKESQEQKITVKAERETHTDEDDDGLHHVCIKQIKEEPQCEEISGFHTDSKDLLVHLCPPHDVKEEPEPEPELEPSGAPVKLEPEEEVKQELEEEQSCSSAQQNDEEEDEEGVTVKKLLDSIRGLSHQLTQMVESMATMETRMSVMETRIASQEEGAVESRASNCDSPDWERQRRVDNTNTVETVRLLHNSEGNDKRYDPTQGLNSPHNSAVTSYLVETLVSSPDMCGVDTEVFMSACNTYYETVQRNFRCRPPDLSAQAEMKGAALSRQRRMRLLGVRTAVLAKEELTLWSGVTVDMMSDEEDGTADGEAGWIVRPPSFRSQELSALCSALQKRLETDPKYKDPHHNRLRSGPPSKRPAPSFYDPEAAKRHMRYSFSV